MIHDFIITEKYAIIPENPAIFKPEDMLKNKLIIQMDREICSRYYVLQRETGEKVCHFDMPSHYVFHYANAYDDVINQQNVIVI